MSNVIIEVEHLSKLYELGTIGTRTLRESLQRRWYRVRGREHLLHKVGAKRLMIGPDHPQAGPRPNTMWALKDVSFTVGEGEVLGIIGRNGAGKSTLLKILTRITEPTSGRAVIHGRVASLLEVGTGFHPELTGRENIYLNGAILGMKKAEIARKFDEIVAFSEVEQFIDTPVKRYSSGMYVRLAFAVAAHLEPEILLVDEVLAVGDVAFQNKCLGKMENVAKEGRTVFFVSHNLGAVQALTQRCLLLQEGRLLRDAPTSETVAHYAAAISEPKPDLELPRDPMKPIQIRKCFLENAKGRSDVQFGFSEGFSMVLQYEVHRPVEGCSLWFGLRTILDVIVFGSADTDTDRLLNQRREPGCYTARIQIPPSWLNAGKYVTVVGITLRAANFERFEMAPFTILNTGVPDVRRPGILQPYMKWRTDRTELCESAF